jgi:aminopeptidase N
MGLHRSALAGAEKAQGTQTNKSLLTTTDEELYRSKAMFVWWMLRDMVGESVLKQALKAYRAEDDNDPSYMQKLIETTTHRDLRQFFEDWVYQDRGLPDFRVASVYPRAMDTGGYVVTVSVENLGAACAETPITVRMQTGEVTKRLAVNGKSTASIRIEVPSKPEEVLVNDGSVPESDMSNNSFKVEPAK